MQTRQGLVPEAILNNLMSMQHDPCTLMGSTLDIFRIIYDLAKLSRDGRQKRNSTWNDETLIDTVTSASALERRLEDQKEHYARLVAGECAS